MIDDPADKENWKELYRCTVCETWMEPGERVLSMRIGMVHKGDHCIREVAGLSTTTLC